MKPCIGGSKGGVRDEQRPRGFFHFHAVFTPTLGVGVSLRKMLCPPLPWMKNLPVYYIIWYQVFGILRFIPGIA